MYRSSKTNGSYLFEPVPLTIKRFGEVLTVTSIIKDQNGSMWIGTFGDGLICLSPNERVEQYTAADGLPHNQVERLLEDENGRVWAGMRWSENGLGDLYLLVAKPQRDQPIVERCYTMRDGLPQNWVTALYQKIV